MGLESNKREFLGSAASIKKVELPGEEENRLKPSEIITVLEKDGPQFVAALVEAGMLQSLTAKSLPESFLYSTIPESTLESLFGKLAKVSALRKDSRLAEKLAFFGPQQEKISRDSFYTKKFRALHTVINNPALNGDPYAIEFLAHVEDMLLQDGQMIDPDTLVAEVADTAWREENVPSYLRTSALSGLNYTFSFFWNKKYENAIVKNLDFKNPDRYARTGHFLEMLQGLYRVGSAWAFSENRVPAALERTLERVVERKDGSYLLNLRAQQLYDRMHGGEMWPEGDRVPFLITKERYAWRKENGLYVSEPEDAGKISNLITELKSIEDQIVPPQDLIDAARANGETEVTWMPDQELVRARKRIHKEVLAAISHKLTYEDLSGDQNIGMEEDARQGELHDFSYLMHKPVRDAIEKEFRLTLPELPIEDQYNVLVFLKTVEKRNASPLFLEATRALRRIGALNLNQIRGMRFERKKALELDPATRAQMYDLYQRRNSDLPEAYRDKLFQKATDALSNPNAYFHVLTFEGRLIGMNGFQEQYDESGNLASLYAGYFAVDAEFGSGKLGEELFEVSLKHELQRGVPIEGDARQGLPIFPKYLEWGFAAEGIEDLGGIPRWHVVLDPKQNNLLLSKKMKVEEIITRASNGQSSERSQFVMLDDVPSSIPSGFLMTRLIERNNKYYVAFERPAPESLAAAA